jgi:type I restriction enzyme, S subunit
MGSNLTSMRLADCMDAIIDYRGKTPTKTASGIPLITAKIIKNGHIQEVNEFIAKDDYDAWMRRGIPQEGDIVLTTEAPLGEVAQLDARKIALAQRVITLRGKQGVLDNDYLLYLLQSHDVQHQLDGRGTGSTVKGIKQSELKEIILTFPSINAQKRIAHYLKSITNKITLNRQINQTLEQMAQALFKSWFVDFDPVIDNALDAGFFEQDLAFPDELLRRAEARRAVREHGAYLEKSKPLPDAIRQLFPAAFEECAEPSLGLGGWVPQGWMVQTCEEVSKKIGMGPFGSNIKTSTFVGHGVPIINGKQLSGFILDGEFSNYITPEHAVKLSSSMVCAGDIVLTHRGTIGQVSIIPTTGDFDNYIVSQSQFYLRPDTKKLGKNYLSLFLRSAVGQQSLLSNSAQVGVPAIARPSSHLKQLKLIVPTDFVQEKFETLTDGYINSICLRKSALKTLAKLRDTLLPKLISGELRLDNIEAALTKDGVA